MRSKHLRENLYHAFAGFGYVIRTQRSIRIQLGLAAIAVVLGLVADFDVLEWALLALSIGLVISAEIVNTVVEAVVDMITQEFHPLAKVAKDAAAAAVLVAAAAAIAIALLLFVPRLLALF